MTDPAVPDAVAVATRRFAVPAERVFDAWLEPALVARWMFAPTGDAVLHVHIDPRVGGAFSFLVRRDGREIDHVGVYRAIERPRRLAFSWGVAGDGDGAEITVDVAPTDDGCEATVRHHLPPDWAHFAPRATESWTRMLDALARTLGLPAA